MTHARVPPYIRVGVIARACGYTRKEAIGLVRRAGILERNGNRLVVNRSKFRARLRDAYQDVFGYYTEKLDARRLKASQSIGRASDG